MTVEHQIVHVGGIRYPVALVPTMGALHEGHRALIRHARSTGAFTVVSIFVNPLQFGPGEDLDRYPRTLDADLALCKAEGVDRVLVPEASEMYAADRSVTVSAGPLGAVLEGAARPGHFDGVLTVVLKLFHRVQPDRVVLGEKDAQQLACVRAMVRDLDLDIEVLGVPTVRDADGLALSSRNIHLSPAERALALNLPVALEKAAAQASVPAARAAAYEVLERAGEDPAFRLDYASLVDPATFAAVPDDHRGRALLVLAARVGRTRLIDNATITFG